VQGAQGVPNVDVTFLGSVTEEGRVPVRQGGAPMPLPWVPGKVLYETDFEYPKGLGLLVRGRQLLGDFESRP
jgi:hypothetical protein